LNHLGVDSMAFSSCVYLSCLLRSRQGESNSYADSPPFDLPRLRQHAVARGVCCMISYNGNNVKWLRQVVEYWLAKPSSSSDDGGRVMLQVGLARTWEPCGGRTTRFSRRAVERNCVAAPSGGRGSNVYSPSHSRIPVDPACLRYSSGCGIMEY
jgi:hypothetical protein